jgi:aquaporin Z
LLQHPASIVRRLVSSIFARRAMMGLAMGATAIAKVMSPWGKRSGGHLNPAITFTFYRMRKLNFWDAGFYVVAQFIDTFRLRHGPDTSLPSNRGETAIAEDQGLTRR